MPELAKYPLAFPMATRNRCENVKRERESVTVCVAAICKSYAPNEQFFMVVGAADRMLTAGDIEFEPEQPKVWAVTSSIFCLLAGDSALQTEIMQGVWQVVTSRVAAQPANWWKVAEVAELYAQFYRKVSFKRAVNSILSPLGLTDEEFIAKQRIMSPELTRDLTYQLQNFDLGSPVAAIVCGVDISAAHIYVAKNGGLNVWTRWDLRQLGWEIGTRILNSCLLSTQETGRLQRLCY